MTEQQSVAINNYSCASLPFNSLQASQATGPREMTQKFPLIVISVWQQ